MRRPLWSGVVCGLGLVVCSLSATGAEPRRPRGAERREAVEKILEEPLDWELDNRQEVTLAELIEHVRARHGLSIRWDAATFQMLSGGSGGLGLAQRSTGGVSGLCGYTCPPSVGYAPDVQYLSLSPAGAPIYSPQPLSSSSPAGTLPAAYGEPITAEGLPAPLLSPGTLPSTPVPVPGTVAVAPAPSGSPVAINDPSAPQKLSPSGNPVPASKAAPATPPATAKPPAGPDAPITPLVADEPGAIPPTPAPQPPAAPTEPESEQPLHEQFARMPVSREALSLEGATIEEGLRQMLDAAIPPIGSMGEDLGIPIVTRAMTLDYVIEGNSVLITTQLRANTRKETRVYRIGHLKTVTPEALSRVITHTIRPWSWRNQATEIAERLAARWPKGDLLKLPLANLDGVELLSGIKLTSGQATPDGSGLIPAGGAAGPQATPGGVSDEAIAATGQLLAGGAVATVQSIVAALEIVHHGDPPTGVIESLPGMLVITQSQGAHREIAALLDELSASAE